CETQPRANAGTAAKVNGREIPAREFNRAYYTQLEALRGQNAAFNDQLARQLGFPKQILDRMVDAELLAQAAVGRGVAASDNEVRDVVVKSSAFQKDGKFDKTVYEQVLHDFYRKTPADYEDEIRRQLSADKLLDVVEGTAAVSEDEVKAKFLREGNQADVTFVRFLPSIFAAKVPPPSPPVLASYLQSHAKEVEAAYQANVAAYQTPERIKARQIVITASGGDAGVSSGARDRLAVLKKEIAEGKPFAQAAKETSEDAATRASGGDLGWVERQKLPPQVAQAAFALAPGQVSEPVETPTGTYLIQVEEKAAAQTRPLQEVESEVARQLYVKERAAALAQAEAQKALAWAQAGKSLAVRYPPEKGGQAAALRFETETRPEAVATGAFGAVSDAVPHLGPAPALVADVFALKAPAPLSKLYPVGEGFAVAVVTQRTLPDEKQFAEKKDALIQDARWAKRTELRDAYLKALRKSANVVVNEAVLNGTEGTG
ncbi:MAG TPA: SurA N-terminal domain-containing protein, partial [Myxococcaceae bacterium]|nr:SurA N-terminal domain-containing protein [Myxococcaceae bacterium]